MSNEPFLLEVDGYCPVCEQNSRFRSTDAWLRHGLICPSCPGGSVPRERALALVLRELRPNWKAERIHESSPGERGISVVLKRDCPLYVGSHFYPDRPPGSMVGEWRVENLEAMTFGDSTFDIVVTQDVMEHVFHPDRVFSEVHRTLDKGGLFLSTFPIQRSLIPATTTRATLASDGTVRHLLEPEYHGNPIDSSGSLVTIDYGYDIHERIPTWADFDVRIYRFNDRRYGILGRYTEVVACWKR